MTFESYASYYDALYGEKDYERECDFLEQIFAQHGRRRVHSVLDLGCGTGGHALPLALRDHEVVGVDRSESMLAEARRKAAGLSAARIPEFIQGDAQSVALGRRFDAVVAMFAVVSYQTTNAALQAMFRTARAHLEPDGLFVFDGWFGPGVLSTPPTDRLKEVETDSGRILRFAHPELNLLEQTVKVAYRVVRLDGDHIRDEVREEHLMRFLFPQEISLLLEAASFRLLHMCPFLRLHEALGTGEWSFTAIAEAV